MNAGKSDQKKRKRKQKKGKTFGNTNTDEFRPVHFDVPIIQLSVTMIRDQAIRAFLSRQDNVRDAFLYAGLSVQAALGIEYLGAQDPVNLAMGIQMALQRGTLDSILTQMLRMGMRPSDRKALAFHLRALGLEWNMKTNEVRFIGVHPEAEQLTRVELNRRLDNVDHDFSNRLRGAWETYFSQNPDRYRQAIASCRELLDDVIERLGGCGERKRKENVRTILGSRSRAEVVAAVVNLVDSLYGVQSDQQHHEPDERTALFALMETEHVLYFLLTYRRKQGRLQSIFQRA